MNVTCPYCDQTAELVAGAALYPDIPSLHDKKFYSCAPCGAHVGCHDGTTTPLGRLADAELRRAKMNAHAAFDPLWRSRQMTRKAAYSRLAKELGIERDKCHIGMFDLETCRRVAAIAAAIREG
jgi:hypothetical protein